MAMVVSTNLEKRDATGPYRPFSAIGVLIYSTLDMRMAASPAAKVVVNEAIWQWKQR